jgi:hypothetical protein
VDALETRAKEMNEKALTKKQRRIIQMGVALVRQQLLRVQTDSAED